MYASARSGLPNEAETGAIPTGNGTERSFNSRYGQHPAGVKEVTSSMEFSKVGSGFMSQSLAMGKGKNVLNTLATSGQFNNNKNAGELNMVTNTDDDINMSA